MITSKKLKFFVILGIYLVLTIPVFSAPNLNNLPQVILDGHPGWVELYNKAWQIAQPKVQSGTAQNGFVAQYMDRGFNPNIFQWDTCFMTMFGKYSNGEFPSIVSLENFYLKQHSDGYICREIRESDGTDYWSYNHPDSVNPPLFSWAEWQNYLVTGDAGHFTKIINGKTVLLRLVDHYNWIKNNRRRSNNLYWSTGLSCGLDNTPNTGYTWTCLSAQQAQNAYYIARMAEVAGDTNTKNTFDSECQQLTQLVNNLLWDNTNGFYHNLNQDGTFLRCKTPVGFWPMIARIPDQTKADRLVAHLNNPNEFRRLHSIPSLSADDPNYNPRGDYWKGSVWAPTTYETIKGLEVYGYDSLAHDLSKNHLDLMYQVYQNTNTIWENYAPDYAERGSNSRSDFVGWSGCGPIALLIENVLGIPG